MGKVLTRQVDPVSLLCIFINLLKGSGITFLPPAVKAKKLLLVVLRDLFLCLTEGRVWSCLELIFWGSSSCGGQQVVFRKKVINTSVVFFESLCPKACLLFQKLPFSEKLDCFKTTDLQWFCSCCVDDRVCLCKRGVQWNGAQILKPQIRVGHNKR